MLDAIEKLRQRRVISEGEAAQLTSSLFNAYRGPKDDNLMDRLFIKVSQWVEATKFEHSRLDQVLAGRLLVRLNTNGRSFEFYAPEPAEEDSSDR
jgi:hypothetical protein